MESRVRRHCSWRKHKSIEKGHSPFHIYENVDFSDHPHFKIFTKMLGGYEIINSLDHAYLNRKRVYFKNFDIPADQGGRYALRASI